MSKIKTFVDNHKGFVILLGFIILIILFLLIKSMFSSGELPTIASGETMKLTKKELTRSITEKGKAVTETKVQVYGEKALPIESLNVKVGDTVKEGDVIATLDATSIRQQIAQKKASMSVQSSSGGNALSQAKEKLAETKRDLADGNNAAIVGATTAVTNAFDAWKAAEKVVTDYERSLAQGYNDGIVAEENNDTQLVQQAKSGEVNLRQAQEKLADTKRKIRVKQQEAASYRQEADRLQSEVYAIEDRLEQKNAAIKALQEKAASVPPGLSPDLLRGEWQQMKLDLAAKNRVLQGEQAKSPQDTALINTLLQEINSLNLKVAEQEAKIKEAEQLQSPSTGIPKEIESLQRQITDLTRDLARTRERLGEASGKALSLEGEVEGLVASVPEMENGIAQLQLSKESTIISLAQNEKNKAAAKASRKDMIATYRDQAKQAYKGYQDALKNLEITKVGVQNEIRALESNVKSAAAGSTAQLDNLELENLAKDLEKTVIKAPTSGTITAVNGTVGQVPGDALATIETTETLQIKSKVKEFDVNSVSVGMKVEVTSDALDPGVMYTGKVISISPTSMASTVSPGAGNTGSASPDVTYETTIALDNPTGTDLAPDMNVRVKYILAREKNQYSVPTSAIILMGDKKYIRVLEPSGDAFLVKEVRVVTGFSTDVETAISGDELKAEMIVLTNPESGLPGQEYRIIDEGPSDGKSLGMI